jgi:hypothetical protein
MGRPAPTVLMQHESLQVLYAEDVYAVYYGSQPINLRLDTPPGRKYRRVAFPNEGWAKRLAIKLNEMFQTTEFHVVHK